MTNSNKDKTDPSVREIARLDEMVRNLRRRIARSLDLEHPELVGFIRETIRAELAAQNFTFLNLDVAKASTSSTLDPVASYAAMVAAVVEADKLEDTINHMAANIVQALWARAEEIYAENVH